MIYNIKNYNVISPSELGISVSQCGITQAFGEFVSSPRIYKNYVLSFVVEGAGSYFLEGVEHKVSAGQGFLTTPNTVSNWTTDNDNPWKYIFVVLGGTNTKRLLSNIGFGTKSQIFDFSLDEDVIKNLYKMLQTSKSQNNEGYKIMAHFLLISDRLKLIFNSNKKMNVHRNTYLESALTYIDNNYMYSITVNDIAKHLNIERTYLYKLFMQQEGVSPLRFLNKYRLEKAKQMMLHDDIAMEIIAVSVGFYDYSHFCHKFRDEYGIPPGEYRNNLKK